MPGAKLDVKKINAITCQVMLCTTKQHLVLLWNNLFKRSFEHGSEGKESGSHVEIRR